MGLGDIVTDGNLNPAKSSMPKTSEVYPQCGQMVPVCALALELGKVLLHCIGVYIHAIKLHQEPLQDIGIALDSPPSQQFPFQDLGKTEDLFVTVLYH